MRFELIILTVFVMISMLEEMVAGQCIKGEYPYKGGCKECDCGTGARDIDCNGNGRCRCRSDFAPPKCSQCVLGYFGFQDALNNTECIACSCHANGAKGSMGCQSSGQCTCYQGYGELKCDKCFPTSIYRMSYDHCCKKNDCFSRSQGKCIKCANPKQCDDVECECKYSYMGANCNAVKAQEIRLVNIIEVPNAGFLGISTFWYKILIIYCNGKCDIRDLRTKTKNANVLVYGSTLPWTQGDAGKIHFVTSGYEFCKGYGNSKTEQICQYTGTLDVDRFYIFFSSWDNFENANFKATVGNFKKSAEQSI